MSASRMVIGLDLGRHAAKLVWVTRRGKNLSVTRTETLRLPPDATEARALLPRWLAGLGIGKTPCVLGVPGHQLFFQPMAWPADDPRTAAQAAAMEMARYAEMSPEPMTHGHGTAQAADGRRLLLAMARPVAIDALLQQAREWGLNVVEMVPTPIALARAFTHFGRTDGKPRALVNIGHAGVELSVAGDGGVLFARSFAVGAQAGTEALMRAHGLSFAQAENLKHSEGSLAPGDGALHQTLTPPAEMLGGELKACLAMFASLFPTEDGPALRVCVTGGGALLRGLPEWLGQRLQRPTLRGDEPLRRPLGEHACTHALAAGLALFGHDAQPSAFSLLPDQLRAELAFRRQKPFWIASAATAAAILAVSVLGGYIDVARKTERLNAQRRELQRLQDLVRTIEDTKARNARLLELARPVRERVVGNAHIRRLIATLAEAKHPDDWIAMLSDAESYFTLEPAPEGAAGDGRDYRRITRPARGPAQPPPTRLDRIVIEGYTPVADLKTVKALLNRLLELDFVAAADVLGDDQLATLRPQLVRFAPPNSRRFALDVRFQAP